MARPSNWFLPLLICLGLVALIGFVFGQTRNYQFINYDDPGYVAENSEIARDFDSHLIPWAFNYVHGGNWHPLTTLSHWLDIKVFGLRKPGAHHLENVVLHAIASILLFLFLLRMNGRPSGSGQMWLSAFAAAIFAIHPLRVESVAWISERKDVLSAVFFMLTLIVYLSYVRRNSLGRYLLVFFVFALGLLSKPMLLTTPFVMLLLDYWPLGRTSEVGDERSESAKRNFSQLIVEKIPLFALSLGSAVATILAQKEALESVETLPISSRVANALVSCVIYIRQFFWPRELTVFYPHPENHLPLWQPIAAALFLLVITYLAVQTRKRYPYILVGWLWYLIMLAPVLGIIQVGLQGHADRFTYLPGIGLGLILAWGVADLSTKWPVRRAILSAGGIAIILVLVWLARIQVSYWRDSAILWEHTLAVTNNNDVAHTNYSELLNRRKQFPEAITQAEAAAKIRPDNAEAYTNLGYAYMRSGDGLKARGYLEQSLKLRPEGINTCLDLAYILATCPDESVRDGERAVDLAEGAIDRAHRSNPLDLRILAAAFAEAGRFPDALATAGEALKMAKADKNDPLVQELELNLKNYRDNLPLRDDTLIGQPPPSANEEK